MEARVWAWTEREMRTQARVLSSHCAWCRECCHRAVFGVAVAVVAPCVVSWSRSPCCVGVTGAIIAPRVVSRLRLRSLHHVGVATTVVTPCVGRGHHFCTMCGVTVAVAMPRGCRGRCRCVVWVLRVLSLHHVGVAVTVFAPRVLHRM
jgi:hypothetical protein